MHQSCGVDVFGDYSASSLEQLNVFKNQVQSLNTRKDAPTHDINSIVYSEALFDDPKITDSSKKSNGVITGSLRSQVAQYVRACLNWKTVSWLASHKAIQGVLDVTYLQPSQHGSKTNSNDIRCLVDVMHGSEEHATTTSSVTEISSGKVLDAVKAKHDDDDDDDEEDEEDASTATESLHLRDLPMLAMFQTRIAKLAHNVDQQQWLTHMVAPETQNQSTVHKDIILDDDIDVRSRGCSDWRSVALLSPGNGIGGWAQAGPEWETRKAYHFAQTPLRLTPESRHIRGKTVEELALGLPHGFMDDSRITNVETRGQMSGRESFGESSTAPFGQPWSYNDEPSGMHAAGVQPFLSNLMPAPSGFSQQAVGISPVPLPVAPLRRMFELCVNTGPLKIALGELELDAVGHTVQPIVKTDAELFKLIHDRYFQIRKRRRFGILYTPMDIQFVRFSVFGGGNVGIYEKPMSLPSQMDVKNGAYHYFECPLDPLPPIDHRTFFHYFWNHENHMSSQSRLFLDRLPKKLNTSMFVGGQPDQLNLGWGVHIIEGPNKKAISMCVFGVVVASFIVSLTYSLVIHSQESGFGIGQWIVAVGTVGLSAIYFQLSE